MNRKTVGIEDLLGWAYRQELPKAKAGTASRFAGLTPMAKWTELATLVDTSPNGFGCIPDFADEGEPDADAMIVAHEVAALDGIDFGALAGIDMLGDVDAASILDEERVRAHEDGARSAFDDDGILRRSASIAVATAAKLGRRPETPQVGQIRRSFEKRNGKPAWFRMERRDGAFGRTTLVEVDGYDRTAKRPHKDAYRKFDIAPDLGAFVAERIDYRVWRMSLDHLARRLSGALERFDVRETLAARWPWEGREVERVTRVWPCLNEPA